MSIRILEAEPHNIFQQVACDLPYDKLPLNREVIGRILKIRIQKMVELDKTVTSSNNRHHKASCR